MRYLKPSSPSAPSPLPSVDGVLRCPEAHVLVEQHGRDAVVNMVRRVLAQARAAQLTIPAGPLVLAEVSARLARSAQPNLRPVFNLSGTVLHTNLGRAALPAEAIEAMVAAARGAVNLEYDLASGERGERDTHLEPLLCELTGAEAATVVNNNAAAILLVLNTLALGKEVPTSRGELVEIGGSFRMPEIMARSGCRLREVGTTNRTHLHDFAQALGPDTGLVLKVHTSNFVIEGFSASVPEAELAGLCRSRGLPFVVDLGAAHHVTVVDCNSQIGSGALPNRTVPSAGLALQPGSAALAVALRGLPVPVIGRLHDGRLILDLRCLDDEQGFAAQLQQLVPPP